MADTLASFGNKIDRLQKELAGDAIPNRMGMAAKKASLAAASRDLGSDRAFSGFRRRNARLNARYEPMSGSAVELQLYPKGLWVLANDDGAADLVINLTVNAGLGTNGAQVGRQIVDVLEAHYRNGGRPPRSG